MTSFMVSYDEATEEKTSATGEGGLFVSSQADSAGARKKESNAFSILKRFFDRLETKVSFRLQDWPLVLLMRCRIQIGRNRMEECRPKY